MTPAIPPDHPLHRFFAGTIEGVFYSRLGICAPDLVDYLVDLLTHFVHTRDIYMLKNASGQPLRTVAEMVNKAHTGSAITENQHQRLVHRHVGDYTLYWTGLFPEGLGRCKGPKDYFLDYCEQGKESYSIASRLSEEDDYPSSSTLSLLSDHFEDCVYGLTLTRKSWENS